MRSIAHSESNIPNDSGLGVFQSCITSDNDVRVFWTNVRYDDLCVFQLGAIMRCPITKFITHTTSHGCFLVLLAVATFRITESSVSITSTDELDDPQYMTLSHEEKVHSLLKETLRPASTLITHVQMCIVFWISGIPPPPLYPITHPASTLITHVQMCIVFWISGIPPPPLYPITHPASTLITHAQMYIVFWISGIPPPPLYPITHPASTLITHVQMCIVFFTHVRL